MVFGVLFILPTAYGQFSLGVKAGMNVANVQYHEQLPNEPTLHPIVAFHVGGLAQFDLSQVLAINAGVELQGRGFRFNEDILGYEVSMSARPYYVNVPVQLALHGKGVYGALGPYVAFGVGGKHRAQFTPKNDAIPIDDIHQSIEFGTKVSDDFSPIDAGASIDFGFETNMGLRFTLNYSRGFTNLIPKDLRDPDMTGYRLTTETASIGVTYLFRPVAVRK